MVTAPEAPPTAELHHDNPLPQAAVDHIWGVRAIISDAYTRLDKVLQIDGPCSLTDPLQVDEAVQMMKTTEPGVVHVRRAAVWKPRSNPEERWWGLETEDPKMAYELLDDAVSQFVPVALEVATPGHVNRYGHLASMVWTGARTLDPDFLPPRELERLKERLIGAQYLPLGVKNETSGSIDQSLRLIDEINKGRRHRSDTPAPAILILRGGSQLSDAEQWEQQYREAHARTAGRFIVDVAHSSASAHDPGGPPKSELGQVRAIKHVLSLSRDGLAPLGIMMEASDLPSKTDPVIPSKYAIAAARRLSRIRQAQQS